MNRWIRYISCFCLCMLVCLLTIEAQDNKQYQVPFDKGTLVLVPLQDNAVRIQYVEGTTNQLPEWVYVASHNTEIRSSWKCKDNEVLLRLKRMSISVNRLSQEVTIKDKQGKIVVLAKAHQLKDAMVQQESTREATLVLNSPEDEYLFGLGQFQDGYLNVRGLTRRLTQVNTQIAIPFLLSNKGYGLLWNNYGLTDFNPADKKVPLHREEGTGEQVTVNVTSTEGGKKEVRSSNVFKGKIQIPADGKYSLLLDVGQKMARRHHLNINGQNVIDVRNIWLPPTTSLIVDLKAGTHELSAELERGDQPVVYYKKVTDETVFHSPVAE